MRFLLFIWRGAGEELERVDWGLLLLALFLIQTVPLI